MMAVSSIQMVSYQMLIRGEYYKLLLLFLKHIFLSLKSLDYSIMSSITFILIKASTFIVKKIEKNLKLHFHLLKSFFL